MSLLKELFANVALNEFAKTPKDDGGDTFDPKLAKAAEEDGNVKGASLADVVTLERGFKITSWDTMFGGLYKQNFAKGWKAGRNEKMAHDKKQYGLKAKLNADGSITQLGKVDEAFADKSGMMPMSYKPGKGDTIEAYGRMGMKNKQFRKFFKTEDAMVEWADDNDATIEGTRDLDTGEMREDQDALDIMNALLAEGDDALQGVDAELAKEVSDALIAFVSPVQEVTIPTAHVQHQIGLLKGKEQASSSAQTPFKAGQLQKTSGQRYSNPYTFDPKADSIVNADHNSFKRGYDTVKESAEYAKKLVRGEKHGPGVLNKLSQWFKELINDTVMYRGKKRFLSAVEAKDQLKRAGFSDHQISLVRDAAAKAGYAALERMKTKYPNEIVVPKHFVDNASAFQVADLYLNVGEDIREEFAEAFQRLFDLKMKKIESKLEIVKESEALPKGIAIVKDGTSESVKYKGRVVGSIWNDKNGWSAEFLKTGASWDSIDSRKEAIDQILDELDLAPLKEAKAEKLEGWYVYDKNEKCVAGPLGEQQAKKKAEALGGDEKGYVTGYTSDYAVKRANEGKAFLMMPSGVLIENTELQSIGKALKNKAPVEAEEDDVTAVNTPPAEKTDVDAESSEEPKAEETPAFKIGDIVTPTKGPHKGERHEVIHVFPDGAMNIKPKDLVANQIKYRLGAAKAQPGEVVLAEDLELSEGWKKENPKSQEKTNRDREGRKVSTPDGPGTVKTEYKIPTFSQMVPYKHEIMVKLDSGESKMFPAKLVKFDKVSEGYAENFKGFKIFQKGSMLQQVSTIVEATKGTKWNVSIEYGPTGADVHKITVDAESEAGAVKKAEAWAKKNNVRSPMINTPTKASK